MFNLGHRFTPACKTLDCSSSSIRLMTHLERIFVCVKSESQLYSFCMWISSCLSTICWTDCNCPTVELSWVQATYYNVNNVYVFGSKIKDIAPDAFFWSSNKDYYSFIHFKWICDFNISPCQPQQTLRLMNKHTNLFAFPIFKS